MLKDEWGFISLGMSIILHQIEPIAPGRCDSNFKGTFLRPVWRTDILSTSRENAVM